MLSQGVLAWPNGMERRLLEIIALGRGGHHRSFEAGVQAHLFEITSFLISCPIWNETEEMRIRNIAPRCQRQLTQTSGGSNSSSRLRLVVISFN